MHHSVITLGIAGMKHWNKIDWLFLSSVCEPFFVFRYVWGDKKLKLQDRSTNYVKTKARWTRLPTRILSMLTWICYKISLGIPKIFQNSAIHICTIDILFCQITTFIKICVAFVFGLQTLQLTDCTKMFGFKGLKLKNKSHKNFYECCDLTKITSNVLV